MSIKKHFVKGNCCVYICANRDYPTTVSLTAERRLKLLQLAKEYQFAIIEDDYDYDFQFWLCYLWPAQMQMEWYLFGKAWTIFISEFSNRILVVLISEAKTIKC
jgi:DNA-binding transcriptional MocR family regulator